MGEGKEKLIYYVVLKNGQKVTDGYYIKGDLISEMLFEVTKGLVHYWLRGSIIEARKE